jgi:hypothetical protein
MVEVPATRPFTTPETLIVATLTTVLLHIPPGAASESVVLKPRHTDAVPVMAPGFGEGLTVTTFVAMAVPQLLVTE